MCFEYDDDHHVHDDVSSMLMMIMFMVMIMMMKLCVCNHVFASCFMCFEYDDDDYCDDDAYVDKCVLAIMCLHIVSCVCCFYNTSDKEVFPSLGVPFRAQVTLPCCIF